MHKYTQLMKDELETMMRGGLEKEWGQIIESYGSKGLLFSSAIINKLLEVGLKSLNTFMDRLLEAEKTALSKETGPPPAGYFEGFARGLIAISTQEINIIRYKIIGRFQSMRMPVGDVLAVLGANEASIRESINRRVQMMEHELKWRESKTITQQIQIGGDVGVINTGQVYGSINAKLERFSGVEGTQLAEAFSRIARAIKDSTIDEQNKSEQLENLDFLVDQYKIPEAQRKKGVIKTVIHGIEKSLSTAASLATLWGQFGPVIMKAFGIE